MDEIIRERRAEQRFAQFKESRDNAAVGRALDRLTRAAGCSENLFYPMKGPWARFRNASRGLRPIQTRETRNNQRNPQQFDV